MYFYSLGQGANLRYREELVYHTKNFSRGEFIKMFNDCIEKGGTTPYQVVMLLCENYGFKEIEPSISVMCDYGSYVKIKDSQLKSQFTNIDASSDQR